MGIGEFQDFSFFKKVIAGAADFFCVKFKAVAMMRRVSKTIDCFSWGVASQLIAVGRVREIGATFKLDVFKAKAAFAGKVSGFVICAEKKHTVKVWWRIQPPVNTLKRVCCHSCFSSGWVPAFAGMTVVGDLTSIEAAKNYIGNGAVFSLSK
jgi:hypothetical protein